MINSLSELPSSQKLTKLRWQLNVRLCKAIARAVDKQEILSAGTRTVENFIANCAVRS